MEVVIENVVITVSVEANVWESTIAVLSSSFIYVFKVLIWWKRIIGITI